MLISIKAEGPSINDQRAIPQQVHDFVGAVFGKYALYLNEVANIYLLKGIQRAVINFAHRFKVTDVGELVDIDYSVLLI
jgi:hypothetical protein